MERLVSPDLIVSETHDNRCSSTFGVKAAESLRSFFFFGFT